jgi:hypothetical protein
MGTNHLVGALEARVGHLGDRVLLVVGLIGGDDGSVGGEREVDPREGDQVGLELVQVDIEGPVESERGGNGRDDLSDKSVEVGVGGGLDAEVSSADLVDTKRGQIGEAPSADRTNSVPFARPPFEKQEKAELTPRCQP